MVTNLSGLYRYRIGDVVKIVRFHNNCPVIEYQYRQGQILNVRAEKTSERVLYDALTSVLNDRGQRFRLVDYTCAESIMFDEGSRLFGDDEKSVAPFYVVFLELSGGGLEEEERKEIQTKVNLAWISCFLALISTAYSWFLTRVICGHVAFLPKRRETIALEESPFRRIRLGHHRGSGDIL